MAGRFIRCVVCFAAMVVICLSLQSGKVSADSSDSIIKIYLDTEELNTKVPAKVKGGQTYVPVRAVFEALGMKVTWEPKKQLLTLKKGESVISLIAGEKKAMVNGKVLLLQVGAENIDGAMQVPLQFVEDATGAVVYWDPYVAEVSILTKKFIKDSNLDIAELNRQVKEYLEEKKKEAAVKKKEEQKKEKTDPVIKKKPKTPVDLNKLNGMYYGFRDDFGGYECGGLCWDIYTFLPNGKVVVGTPLTGGPETINCKTEDCLTYSISKGQLKLSNGKTYPIKKSATGFLIINGTTLDKVEPVPKSAKFDGKYTFVGYSGLIGVTPAARSWRYTLTLKPNGAFELDGLSLGSLITKSVSTHATGSVKPEKGKYTVHSNTITFKGSDGKVHKALFFLHNGDVEDIQVGARNYYTD